MDNGEIGLIIVVIVLAGIVGTILMNKGDLNRYQALKNKRRFGGKRLSVAEQDEIDKLARKYWWY